MENPVTVITNIHISLVIDICSRSTVDVNFILLQVADPLYINYHPLGKDSHNGLPCSKGKTC